MTQGDAYLFGGLTLLSGDLEPVCPARCEGFVAMDGAYVHTEGCRRTDATST